MNIITFMLVLLMVIAFTDAHIVKGTQQTLFQDTESCVEETDISSMAFSGNIYYEVYDSERFRDGLWRVDDSLQPVFVNEGPVSAKSAVNASASLLAYTDAAQVSQIFVIDHQGNPVANIDWNDERGRTLSWTLDNRLTINHPSSEATEMSLSIISLPDEVYVESINNLPYIVGSSSRNPVNIRVSPLGNMVVYDGSFPERLRRVGREIFLTDFATNTVVWHTETLGYGDVQRALSIDWSPDGTQFAYPRIISHFIDEQIDEEYNWNGYRTDISVVNQNGGEYLITNFTNNGQIRREQRALSWSPDGTRIAFWLTDAIPDLYHNSNSTSATLYVIDLEEKTISNLCLGTQVLFPELIWSPDSSMVVEQYGLTRVININEGTYSSLDVDVLTILGWLRN